MARMNAIPMYQTSREGSSPGSRQGVLVLTDLFCLRGSGQRGSCQRGLRVPEVFWGKFWHMLAEVCKHKSGVCQRGSPNPEVFWGELRHMLAEVCKHKSGGRDYT